MTDRCLALMTFLAMMLLVGAACDHGRESFADAHPIDPVADAAVADASVDARTGFWLTGVIRAVSGTVPADGKLLVFWHVTDDAPRTGTYKHGEVVHAGAGFELAIPAPPAMAWIVPELAVAQLLEVPTATTVADGDFELDDEHLPGIRGGSLDQAIIYRSGATGEAHFDAFPIGPSCGRCVQNPDDNAHDWWEPTSCDGFTVSVGLPDDARSCNWR